MKALGWFASVLRFQAVVVVGLMVLGGTSSAFGAGGAPTATALKISAAGSPVMSVAKGTVVTLTATVTLGGSPLNPGQVKFCDAAAQFCEDSHLLATAQLTGAGIATYSFQPAIGSHSYKAVFVGKSSASGSSSSATNLSVTGKWHTTTTYSEAGSSGSASLTATVVGTGTFVGAPSGQISFLDLSSGNAVVASAPLGAGTSALNFLSEINGNATSNYTVLADFNGDGILDFATLVNGSGSNSNESIGVSFGNGDGTFHAGPSFAVGLQTLGMVTADFNDDGKPDLAYWDSLGTGLTVLLGNGDGTFTQSSQPATGGSPSYVAIGDFNDDGIEDMAVACTGNTRSGEGPAVVSILLGVGDGTFTAAASSPATSIGSGQIVTADFNRDGNLDLAVENGPVVSILLGSGNGTFSTGASFPDPTVENHFLVTGDYNGDGVPDLIYPQPATSPTSSNSLVVLLGNGDGTFSSHTEPVPQAKPAGQQFPYGFNFGFYPPYASVGDINGDGKADLVIGNNADSDILVLLGDGEGAFTAGSQAIAEGRGNGSPLALGDLNGDGSPDVVYNPGTILLTERTESASASVAGVSITGVGNLKARFPGDTNFAASEGGQAPTPTSLTISASPSTGNVVNQPVTLTATLSPYSEAGYSTNGETVTFLANASPVGTGTLVNGIATFSYVPALTADYAVSATYPGDGTSAPSQSAVISLPVAASGESPFATTLTLTQAPPGPLGSGSCGICQTVLLTATLSPFTEDGYTTNKGEIDFTINTGGQSYTVPVSLVNGVATYQDNQIFTPGVAVTFTASFRGDAHFLASTSPTIPFAPASTTALELSSGGNTVTSVVAGTPVTLTAFVQSLGSAVPQGTVNFCLGTASNCTGANLLGTAQLTTAGKASLTIHPTGGYYTYAATFTGTRTASASSSSTSALEVTTQGVGSCQTISYNGGFVPTGITLNGGATISNGMLQLTDGQNNEARSAFYSTLVPVSEFTSDFTFQVLNGSADGFTFVLQPNRPTEVGVLGGGLGYAGIPKSLALKFDLHDNQGEGIDSTGIYLNGAMPTIPAIDLAPAGIDLHSGHVFSVHLTYANANTTATITDTVTGAAATWSVPGDLTGVLGANAFAGFTGASGGAAATQNILSWSFSGGPGCSGPPPATGKTSQMISFGALHNVTYGAAPVSLAATATSGLPVSYSVTGPGSISGNTLFIEGAGTITVTASQVGNASFAPAPSSSQSFGVAKAPLTVTANQQERSVGSSVLNNYYYVMGFVNGDTIHGVLTGTATLTTTATSTSPAGFYPLTFLTENLGALNYTLTYVPSTLVIQ